MLRQQDQSKQQNQQLEESYERQYGKIGRDFVHIDDVRAYIDRIRIVLAQIGIVLPPFSPSAVYTQGEEYKSNIENGKDLKGLYNDIVVIDESDDAEESDDSNDINELDTSNLPGIN